MKTLKQFINEQEQSAWEKYPPKNHLHIWTHGHEQYHVIKGVPHTDEAYNKVVDDHITNVAKHAKISRKKTENVFANAEGHHAGAEEKIDHVRASKVDHIHENAESYSKHHLKDDAEWVKDEIKNS